MKNEEFCAWIKKIPYDQLKELSNSINEEQERRESLIQLRKNWVQKRVEEFHHARGKWTAVGNTVIIAVINKENQVSISKAFCSSADKFNALVGIAVAYARIKGEKVPEYI